MRTTAAVRAVVLSSVERELDCLEWQERPARRPTTNLGIDAATLIAEERLRRDRELGGLDRPLMPG